MISFHILPKRFFRKRKRLSDARVVSIIKEKYGFALQFFGRYVKSSLSISDA